MKRLKAIAHGVFWSWVIIGSLFAISMSIVLFIALVFFHPFITLAVFTTGVGIASGLSEPS